MKILGIIAAGLLSLALAGVAAFSFLSLNSMTGCVSVTPQQCMGDIAVNDLRWTWIAGPLVSALFVAPLLLKGVPGLRHYWVRFIVGGLLGAAIVIIPLMTYRVPVSSVIRFCDAGSRPACHALRALDPAAADSACQRLGEGSAACVNASPLDPAPLPEG